MASSCSQCLGQNINSGFQCGWCSDQCTVSSQCNDQLVTMSGGCDTPVIADITPASGPPRGQTTITIIGTNLGVAISDIVSVTVGERTCNVNDYSTGVRIVCMINDTSNDPSQGTVTVTINTSNGPVVATSDLYTISIPTVESIIPSYGPVSGGTIVTITGNNLDIGNKDNTRVLFRETTSNRRKRQSCPETECTIKSVDISNIVIVLLLLLYFSESSFNSSYLTCSSSMSGSSDCVMTVVVNIDGDEYSNDNERFMYTPDPEFTSVSPQEVIPA